MSKRFNVRRTEENIFEVVDSTNGAVVMRSCRIGLKNGRVISERDGEPGL